MLYGNAKRRQMARSLLPSTRRRAAADNLDRIRRGGRRRLRQELADLTGKGGAAASRWTDASFDWAASPQREIKEAVWERRAYDKVGSFQRWAVAVTLRVDPADRLDAVRGLLPPNLIGRHALSHIEFLDHFCGHLPSRYWAYRTPARSHPRARFERELHRVLNEGELATFNAHMKRMSWRGFGDRDTKPVCRTLAGVHDVEAFLDDCFNVSYVLGRREWGRPVSPSLEHLQVWEMAKASHTSIGNLR